jgi:hypothetical protein
MKKIILATLISILATTSIIFAEEPETLFGSENVTIGGYVGPEVKFTNINNDFGLMIGGRIGMLVNSNFTLGIGGYGLVTSHAVDNYYVQPNIGNNMDSSAYLRVGYGGLHLGYIFEPSKVAHISVGVLVGAGGAAYTSTYWHNNDNFQDHNNFTTYESSAFFTAEPMIGAEINIVKMMRIEASASYRYVSGLGLSNTENKDISGFSGNIIFKFGKF